MNKRITLKFCFTYSVCRCLQCKTCSIEPDVAEALLNNINSKLSSFLIFLEETEQRNGNSCPVDCEKVSYKSSLSAALYLPQKMLPVLKYSNLKEAKNMPNDTDGMVNFML